MKKHVINFITIILLILISSNLVFAEKIVCKLEEDCDEIIVFLVLYNNDGLKLDDIVVIKLISDELNDNQLRVLNLMNGIEICDQDKWYEPLIELTSQLKNLLNQLNRLNRPLLSSDAQQIKSLYSDIFKILGWKTCELRYDH